MDNRPPRQGMLPPNPNSQTLEQKRAAFSKNRRARAFSSGSTRGAFGPGVGANEPNHNHSHGHNNNNNHGHNQNRGLNQSNSPNDIYQMQQAAMTGNLRHINTGLPSEVNISGTSGTTSGAVRGDEEFGNVKSPRGSLVRTPSGDANTNFVFSHHSPTYDDIRAAADKESEIQKFSSMAMARQNSREGEDSHNAQRRSNGQFDYGGVGTAVQNHSMDADSTSEYTYDDGEPLSYSQSFLRFFFYDPDKPEFTSLQQTSWAVIIGVFMGVFTALWGEAVEASVEFCWGTVPEYLLEQGIFTDLDGWLPLPHYMWICPAFFGGLLAYITAEYEERGAKIPGQNEWIEQCHRIGVMDHDRFVPIVVISTLGMASGLSLGPEMPLVLSAGMVGSWLALKTNQSVLSARVMNLTAASAGIGGFFGFPMAGALFVLELPHRMGLQYFEALSPAVLSSIVSVLINRWAADKQNVEGYFNYPFLAETLPSNIFYTSVIYGLVGTFVGKLYADGCVFCKHWVHDWFHVAHDDHDDHGNDHEDDDYHDETSALMGGDGFEKFHKPEKKKDGCLRKISKCITNFFGIKHEPTRAAVAGVMVGVVVGLNCMFLPHQLFWGEAQLQTLIDKGKTPLPVFKYGDEPTAIMTAYGYCMMDPDDDRAQVQGFSIACTGMMSLTKILTIGLSLGTGVCGGHFWGPLYTGCAAAHFFVDIIAYFADDFVIAKQISAFPCIAIICIMGSTHVVTYRCHTAIMLVLTLTITSFTTEQKTGSTAGDYSAVFPLLVVACFVPLMLARGTVFYATQRCRGDIVAIPEVLCEPMKDGMATGIVHDDGSSYEDGSYGDESMSSGLSMESQGETPNVTGTTVTTGNMETVDPLGISLHSNKQHFRKRTNSSTNDPLAVSQHSLGNLSKLSGTGSGGARRPVSVKRVRSFGHVEELQPPLLSQARAGAATTHKSNSRSSTPVNNGPSLPRHRRKSSNVSMNSIDASRLDAPP